MSTNAYFDRLKKITVQPVTTRRHADPVIGIFSVQHIVFHFDDGSKHELTLSLDAGVHALALGELVTHEEVSA
jgi:hypothetical protein